MKIKIVANKYLNALFIVMLVSAAFHMAALFGFALVDRDWHLLNYFHILDIDRLFSTSFNSIGNDIFSWIAAAAIYLAVLKLNGKD